MSEAPLTTRDWSHLKDPPEFPQSERRLVLIASYPRSGSNWVGRTLEHALLSRVGWADPIERGRRGIYHDLDRFIAEGRLDELERWSTASSLVLKTHRTPEALAKDAPGWQERSDLVVGVIRGPLDVMASVLRYLIWSGALTDASGATPANLEQATTMGLVDPFIDAFIDARGHAPFEALGFGNWASHARDWTSVLKERGVRLRYPDLKRDAHATFEALLARLRLGVSNERLNEAITSASPERIGTQFGAGFVHTASDGSYVDVLSAEQQERAASVFASDVARYGLGDGASPMAR